jgi:hypothetical protein
MNGIGLAVFGNVAGNSGIVCATSASAGGAVTTSASATSSHVGLIAITGASFSCTTTGSSGDLTATVTSGVISAGV